jgi:hypothetical protein
MIYVLLTPLILCGFFALCAAVPRHQPHLLSRRLRPAASRRVRAGGWILLTSGFALSWYSFGPGRGMPIFAGIATLGAAVVVGLLTVRSNRRS